ncbi:MAG TPA: hypothetical protein VIK89_01645, partial [Cytophagaceae bacterium]
MKKIISVEIIYNSADLVPPYTHSFHIKTYNEDNYLNVKLNLKYLEREELTEEEILAEGFTLNDDFSWEGSLDKVWKQRIEKQAETAQINTQSDISGEELAVKIFTEDTSVYGVPKDIQSWTYLMQELVQAVYEVSGKELPLKIRYRKVEPGKKSYKIDIQPYFKNLSIEAFKETPGQTGKHSIPLNWGELRKLMERIYINDMYPEHASAKDPVKEGSYIDPGDGLWYRFNNAIKSPS